MTTGDQMMSDGSASDAMSMPTLRAGRVRHELVAGSEHSTRLIGPLQRESFETLWPVCEPMLASALERDGWKLKPDHLHDQIATGMMGLYVIQDFRTAEILAALACEIQEYPNASVFVIAYAGGKELERWVHVIADFEAHAKSVGCHIVRIPGRPGWGRVLGYVESHRVFEKEIA